MLESEFNSLLSSDLSCAGALSFQNMFTGWLTVSIAHYGIGLSVSAFVLFRGYSVAWLWAGIAAILVKEIAFDIPNGNAAGVIVLDSLWDLFCYILGFFVLWGLMASEPRKEAR